MTNNTYWGTKRECSVSTLLKCFRCRWPKCCIPKRRKCEAISSTKANIAILNDYGRKLPTSSWCILETDAEIRPMVTNRVGPMHSQDCKRIDSRPRGLSRTFRRGLNHAILRKLTKRRVKHECSYSVN